MEDQVRTIVCPNCGANTRNYHNCEYCGSLLVRFVSQNKTIDEQRYGKEAKPIPGLEDELKKNLSLQKTCGDGFAISTVPFITTRNNVSYVFGQITSPHVRLRSGEMLNMSSAAEEYGLVYCIPFQTKSLDTAIAAEEKRRLANFKALDCFFLFEPQQMADGVRYTIDFGQDYESAARIISNNLREENKDDAFSFETQMLSYEKLEVDEQTGFLIAPEVSQDSQKKRNYVKAIVLSLISLIIMIIVFSII